MKKLLAVLLPFAFMAAFGFAQEQAEEAPAATGTTIADVLRQDNNLTTFRTAALTGDLGQQLEGEGAYTVFAPTNDAFSVLSQDALNDLLAGGQGGALSQYVVEGVYTVQVLQDMLAARGGSMSLPTVDGNELSLVLSDGGAIVIEGVAGIISSGTTVANGVVLTIDNVFSPTAAAQEGDVAGGGEAEQEGAETEETEGGDQTEETDVGGQTEEPGQGEEDTP
jgi:uncharacterized surface protein with fasciclin (FAS1) repeats